MFPRQSAKDFGDSCFNVVNYQQGHWRIADKFADNGGPLFLKLAFEQARRWKSWDALPHADEDTPGLRESVPGLLEDLFDHLEHQHPDPLVSAALKYIAAAKSGLSEEELEALDISIEVFSSGLTDAQTQQMQAANLDQTMAFVAGLGPAALFMDVDKYLEQRAALTNQPELVGIVDTAAQKQIAMLMLGQEGGEQQGCRDPDHGGEEADLEQLAQDLIHGWGREGAGGSR